MKKAFTVAEFILCLIIMSTVMTGMITVTFKKSKMTEITQKKHNEIVCSCSDDKVKKNNYTCRINIDNPTGRHEFYTIQLLGGGAAASTCRGGGAGEAKIITYPSLESGEYFIQLGSGGNTTDLNGGNTILYKIDEEGNYRVVEFARGGIGETNKTPCEYDELEHYSDPIACQEAEKMLKKGELPTFSASQGTDSGTSCGAGGDSTGNKNGKYGEVIIKW